MKTNYINRTMIPPEPIADKSEEQFEKLLDWIRTEYKADQLFDLHDHDREVAIPFAEWVDINAVRNGPHKWTIGCGNEMKTYTSEQLWELYTNTAK